MANNTNHIELSIIIPAFNVEKHLKKSLESVLQQEFLDFELIIVDDGSTDNTSSICNEYVKLDKRVKYFKEENGGPYKARIFGVEHAQGEYVTFCDADDYYINKTAFNNIHRYIKEYHPDAIQFGYKIKYNHLSQNVTFVRENVLKDKTCFFQDEFPILLCSSYDNSHLTTNVWNKVYKRSLLKALPQSKTVDKVFWGDDLIFNLFALEKCDSFLFSPDILYVYSDNTGGTAKFSKNAMWDLELIKEHQLQFLEKTNHKEINKITSNLFLETVYWFAAWVKDAVNNIDEKELKGLISAILKMPTFISAQDYYLNENSWNWEAIELLRQGSACKYITWAKANQSTKKSFKEKIKKLYKLI